MSLISPSFDVKSIIFFTILARGLFQKLPEKLWYRKRDLKVREKYGLVRVQVSYKFEMLIFKMPLVIKQYVHVSLLFVHTVAVHMI